MKITIATTIKADRDTVWQAWNTPDDIKQWNAASPDWHTPSSSVDLRVGGKFRCRMEARDGSMGFDFEGVYTKIVEGELIEYAMADGRHVSVTFADSGDGVTVSETFDAEYATDAELQRQGWQSILNNFAKYVESKVAAG
jgi:uncharacterized protein YndB with AHSA1/START domain